MARNLSPGGGPVKLKLFSEQEVAEVIQRHENYVTYTIKTISQPKKNRTLLRNIFIFARFVHILLTLDGALNICSMKIKPPEKVKSVMRKEAMKADLRDLSNQSDASENDEESHRLQITVVVMEGALRQPILDFSAIKVLVNKSDNISALINSLTNNLVNINRSNVSELVNLNSLLPENEDVVLTMSNTTAIPAGNLVNVLCKVNLDSTTKSIPKLFETEEIMN